LSGNHSRIVAPLIHNSIQAMKNLLITLFIQLTSIIIGFAQIAPYCNPVHTYVSPDWYSTGWDIGIARVQLGGIDNATSVPTGTGGLGSCTDQGSESVQDFQESVIGQRATLATNGSYTINVTVGNYDISYCSIVPDPNGYEVWIDFNQNGNFSDPGEFIGSVMNIAQNSTVGLPINVPSNATLGFTRMRVYGDDYTELAGDPCFNKWGEMEDYTIEIICGGPNMSYSSSTTTQNTSNTYPGTSNQYVIGIQVVTADVCNPIDVTRFDFSALGDNGTDLLADISNANVWYTGTSSTFSTSTLFGSGTPSASFSVPGTQTLAVGTNYFWLTYDVSSGAVINNYIDAVCNTVRVDGIDRAVTSPSPTGGRQIVAASYWEKTYGDVGGDVGMDVITLADGSIVIAGYMGTPSLEASVTKISPEGSIIWSKTYGGVGNWYALYSIQATSDGGFIACGETNNVIGSNDILVLKLSSTGVVEWSKVFGSTSVDAGEAIMQTTDGNYVVGGYWQSGRMFVMKLDALGNRIWSFRYDGGSTNSSQRVKGIGELTNGNYVITGNAMAPSFNYDGIAAIINPVDGSVIAAREYGGYPWDLVMTPNAPDKGFAITLGDDVAGNGLHVLKVDSLLNRTWGVTAGTGSGSNSRGYGITSTRDGGYVAGGKTTINGSLEMYMAKLTADGGVQWRRSFGGTGFDKAQAVTQAIDGGIILVGNNNDNTLGGSDIYVIKTDANGDVGVSNCTQGTPAAGGLFSTFNGGYSLNIFPITPSEAPGVTENFFGCVKGATIRL